MRRDSAWAQLRPPMWARWVVAFLIGAIVLAALILFVDHNNGNGEARASNAALAREGQEANVLIGQEQAARIATAKPGQPARAALVAAVSGDMRHQLATGSIDGTLQKVSCRRSGARGGRQALRCTAEADNVNYPFVAIYAPRTRRLTYCRRVPPPIPSENIPVPLSCRLP